MFKRRSSLSGRAAARSGGFTQPVSVQHLEPRWLMAFTPAAPDFRANTETAGNPRPLPDALVLGMN